MFIPVPWRAARKHPPLPRYCEFAQYLGSGGKIPPTPTPAGIFLIREKWLKRQTLACSLLRKPESQHAGRGPFGVGSCGGEHPLVLEMGKEGHLPSQHFKDEDAESPPVHCPAVAFALDDFRGQVLRGAAQSPRPDGSKKTKNCG